MRIKIDKNILIKNLKNANLIIGNSNQFNPTLNAVLIEANDDLVFTCSNGQISAKLFETKNFEVIQKGKILCKAKILFSVISKLKENDLEIFKIDESVITIKTKTFSCQINTLDEEIYPQIDFSYNKNQNIKLEMSIIHQVIQKVAWATLIGNEQLKVINAIYFDAKHEPGILNIVATDSFKLSMLKKENKYENFQFLIEPNILKNINEIIKTEEQNLESIDIYLKQNEIVFQGNETIAVYKMIEGTYPNVYNAFNLETTTAFEISKTEFINALDRGIGFVSAEKIPAVKVLIKKEKMNIKFSSYELGNSEEDLEINKFEGMDIELNVNASYLMNLLKMFESKVIRFEIAGQNKPIILKDTKNKDFIQLVLPMRV